MAAQNQNVKNGKDTGDPLVPRPVWQDGQGGAEVERGQHKGRQGLSGPGTHLAGSLKASWPLAVSSLETGSGVLLAAPQKCGVLKPWRQLLAVVGQHQLYYHQDVLF